VREKAAWLAAKRARVYEFSKHAATLLARKVLPDAAVFEATQVLNDAWARRVGGEEGEGEAEKPVRNKASGGCCAECGRPVPVPTMLVCANKVCFCLPVLSFWRLDLDVGVMLMLTVRN
jgi:hypothetical protein